MCGNRNFCKCKIFVHWDKMNMLNVSQTKQTKNKANPTAKIQLQKNSATQTGNFHQSLAVPWIQSLSPPLHTYSLPLRHQGSPTRPTVTAQRFGYAPEEPVGLSVFQTTKTTRPYFQRLMSAPLKSEVTQSCPTLWDPSGLQTGRLFNPLDFPSKNTEWVAISFSRGSSRRRD